MNWLFGNKQEKALKNKKKQEEYEKTFLRKVEYDDVDFFHLNEYTSWAKVSSVYDGDTCSLIFFLNNKPVKFRCRLANIDCAEKKSENPAEVRHAHRAINRFQDFVNNDLIYAKFHRFDKYGRLLVSIYSTLESEHSLNEILIDEGLAYPYSGGKRLPFEEWVSPEYWESDVGFIENK